MANSTVQNYGSKAVFITSGDYATDQTITGSIRQLSRIQSLDWNVNYEVTEQSYLNNATESVTSKPPTIDINLGWIQSNGQNENAIGFPTDGLTSVATNLNAEKNFYVTVENNPGYDAVGASGITQTKTVIGLAQGVLNSYSLSARVGGLLESTASFGCLTAYIYSGQNNNRIPAINYSDGSQFTGLFSLPAASTQYDSSLFGNLFGTFIANTYSGIVTGTFTTPSTTGPFTLSFTGYSGQITGTFTGTTTFDPNLNGISALSYKDLSLSFLSGTPFGVMLTGNQSCHLQSFSLNLGIPREEIKQMGYIYPSIRPITYPVSVDLEVEALLSSYQSDQLQRIGCLQTGHAVRLSVIKPCTDFEIISVVVRGLQLESQNFHAGLAGYDTVSLKWKGIITSPIDPKSNLFFTAP